MPGSTTEEQVHSWRASRTLRGFHVQKTKTIQNPIEQRERVSNVMAQALLGYLQALLRYSIFKIFLGASSYHLRILQEHPKTG